MPILIFQNDDLIKGQEGLDLLRPICETYKPDVGKFVGATSGVAIAIQLILNEFESLREFSPVDSIALRFFESVIETLNFYKEKLLLTQKANPMLNFLETHVQQAKSFLAAGTSLLSDLVPAQSQEDTHKTLLLSGITILSKLAQDIVDPVARENFLTEIKNHILNKLAEISTEGTHTMQSETAALSSHDTMQGALQAALDDAGASTETMQNPEVAPDIKPVETTQPLAG